MWSGRAQLFGHDPQIQVRVEVFIVGEWLAHGNCACNVDVDSIGVVERRLIPAKAWHAWSRLRKDGIHSVWSPASQKHSHWSGWGWCCGPWGSQSRYPRLLPLFKAFFDEGRAARTVLPLGGVCTLFMGIRGPAMIQRPWLERDFYLMRCLVRLLLLLVVSLDLLLEISAWSPT